MSDIDPNKNISILLDALNKYMNSTINQENKEELESVEDSKIIEENDKLFHSSSFSSLSNIFNENLPSENILIEDILNENDSNEVNEFNCDECYYKGRDITDLMDHKMIVHEGAFYDQYICDQCEEVFTKIDDLNYHYDNEHSNKHDYYCDHCDNLYDNINELNEHINNDHCGKFSNSSYYSEHCDNIHDLDEHTEDDYSYKSEDDNDNIVCKIVEQNEDGTYNCDRCENNFIDADELQDHIFIDHGIKEEIQVKNDNDNGKKHESIKIERKKVRKYEKIIKRTISSHLHLNPIQILTQPSNGQISRYATTNGRHICPICSQKFRTQYYLGEHFTEDHQSYEMQINLDDMAPKNSFPGFETLEIINMIYVLRTNKEIKKFLGTKCDICYLDYAIYNPNRLGEDLDKINNQEIRNKKSLLKKTNKNDTGYYSDSEIINKEIKKTTGLNNISKYSDNNYPVMMMCCGKYVCQNCVKANCEKQNNIVCMFCKVDHSLRCEKFIESIYPMEGYHNKSWTNWWKKNDRINTLAFM